MKIIISLIILVIILVGGFFLLNKEEDVSLVDEVNQGTSLVYAGLLTDVTKGEDVRGVNTKGESSGVANAKYEDGRYNLVATFENLPDPVGDDFYEGWVVRKGINFSVISSGKLSKVDGIYTNVFESNNDLTDHDFYVLTLEPNDGDPAPADHIVEGDLSLVESQ